MTLQHPLEIPMNHAAFRDWMDHAGLECKRLDNLHESILFNFYRSGNDIERDVELFGLKCEAECLRDCLAWTWRLWKQLKDEMD